MDKFNFNTSVIIAVLGVIALVFLQTVWIKRYQQAELQKLGDQYLTILNEALIIETNESQWEYNSALIEKGFNNPVLYGGNYDELTLSIYFKHPLDKKVTKQCKDYTEWHFYNKNERLDYMVDGIRLLRLDSIFTNLLKHKKLDHGRHYIQKINTADGNLLETTDSSMFTCNLTTDTLQLGLFDTEALIACFDLPSNLVYKQIQQVLFISLIIGVLLLFVLWHQLKTVFVQMKIAQIRENIMYYLVHEIKNPIIYIDKVLNLLTYQAEETQLKKRAQAKIKHLYLMMDQWLISGSRKPSLTLNRENINLNELLLSYINEFREDFASSGRSIHLTLNYRLSSDFILADQTHLPNAIRNLLDNAVKYSVGEPVVNIECEETNQGMSISVCDRGIGIPKNYLGQVFYRGFRVPSQKAGPSGFGLGLSYVRLVARAYGGKVVVRSRYGQGSCFIINLPKP